MYFIIRSVSTDSRLVLLFPVVEVGQPEHSISIVTKRHIALCIPTGRQFYQGHQYSILDWYPSLLSCLRTFVIKSSARASLLQPGN